jgi:hypothetical protein
MRYQDFLTQVVEESTLAATKDYTAKNKKPQLEGSIAGLRACLDKSPPQLSALLERAKKVHEKTITSRTNINRYWRVRCFLAEVEWVCNVMSVVLMTHGMPTIVAPTERAINFAASLTNEIQTIN